MFAVLVLFGVLEVMRDKTLEGAVHDFLDHIKAERIDAAYAMMSAGYQAANDFDAFGGSRFVTLLSEAKDIDIGRIVAPGRARNSARGSAKWTIGDAEGRLSWEPTHRYGWWFFIGEYKITELE